MFKVSCRVKLEEIIHVQNAVCHFKRPIFKGQIKFEPRPVCLFFFSKSIPGIFTPGQRVTKRGSEEVNDQTSDCKQNTGKGSGELAKRSISE